MGVLIAAKRTAYRRPMTQQSDARDDVAEALKQKLPASLGTPSMPGTEGWSLESVRVERFFGHPVVSIGLTGNDRRHDFHLFPANALEEPYYRDEHFDFVYIDDAQENRGRRDRAVIDQFVRWLGATFRPRTRKLSPIATAEVKPPPPAPPTPAEIALLDTLGSGLAEALRTSSLPALAGWTLRSVALEPFRDRPTPTLELSQDNHALRVYLLPSGSNREAFFRTSRFDVLYDDDERASNYTHNHAALEALVEWLDATFSAKSSDPDPTPTRRPARPFDPAAPTPPGAELAELIETALAEAMQHGELPTLERWSLGTVGLAPFRGHEALTIHLAHGDRKQRLRLLPAQSDPEAFFRTDRFDVFYDDDERGAGFTQDHAALESVVAWLGATFPLDENELARRRTQRLQQLQITAEQTALASALDARLREALATAALPELGGWTFLGADPAGLHDEEAQTIRLARDPLDPSPRIHRPLATIKLTRDGHELALHLLPANAEALAPLRTDRFDIIIVDDAQNSTYTQHHDALEALTRWLDTAFPLGESELARRRLERLQQMQATPEQIALANTLGARLREAIIDGSFPLPEGWRLDAVALEQQQGITAPTVRFLHGERPFVLRVLPTSPLRTTPLRTSRFDVLYDSEPGDWQSHDEPVARGLVTLLETLFPNDSSVETPQATES